jgi:hypothetical protein
MGSWQMRWRLRYGLRCDQPQRAANSSTGWAVLIAMPSRSPAERVILVIGVPSGSAPAHLRCMKR